MQAVAERILQLAAAPNTTVLICGESGTGKEVAARALHFHSPRRRGPFVPFNCASVPETLIESELFGHEAGAFTGAQTRRRGRFELADGGTLLLDEVGELSLQAQAKLLRVLETRQFERVGGERPIRVDVRIVAATNRDLEAEVRAGRFRADLYHRLRVATVELPPLRERVEDIPLLVQAFIEEFSAANKKNVRGITSRALRLMERYPWYGNVRELRNAVEAMVVVAQSEVLDVEDLPVWLTRAVTRDSAAKADGSTQQRGHNPDSRLRGNELEGDRTGSDPSNASVDRRESDGGRAHSRNRSANAVPQAEGVRTMNHWETTWASVGLAAGAGVRLQVAEVEAPTLWSAQVAPDHRPGVGDFLGPGIAVVVLAALGWLAWRWSQTRATRGLRRAVRRARRFNEQTREMTFPHPVPEMEAERRADIPRSSASSQEPEERRSVRSGRRQRAVRERAPSERNEEEAMEQPVLDPRDLDALKRLEAIQQEWDPKEPRTAYRRLEDFIRRYLFETFGVRAFGMRTSELLAALPRSTEDALFDYVAEILTTCELAELPRHRPDRREVEHLIRLAREVVLLQARTARRGDRSPKQS
ncbi:MAG: hypothetical protein KatS3mg115_0783 [Candidatus Poribacteria bacterium]|nr:MAG: hypothetical protein KatS3mg115_0783 [Candidatus Poribacteria bacterium]